MTLAYLGFLAFLLVLLAADSAESAYHERRVQEWRDSDARDYYIRDRNVNL